MNASTLWLELLSVSAEFSFEPELSVQEALPLFNSFSEKMVKVSQVKSVANTIENCFESDQF